jgi:hypothetical protein
MKTERDMTRIVRSWLEVGADRLPDRVLDSVLDQLPAHRQRRRPLWWPQREFHMNTLAKTAIAAAAVLVVAFLGYQLLPGNGSVGTGPTPTPTATPIPTLPPAIKAGSLAPGSYYYSFPSLTRTPFTVTVPAGWALDADSFITKGDWKTNGVFLGPWLLTHVYTDPCADTLQPVVSKADVVAALAAQTRHQTAGPTEVMLGGVPATRFEFSVPTGYDIAPCEVFVHIWPDPGPNTNGGLPMFIGQTTDIYVVDIGGKVTVFVALRNESSAAGDVAELQATVDSIQFRP